MRRLRQYGDSAAALDQSDKRIALYEAASELESLGQEPAGAAKALCPDNPDSGKPWRHMFSASEGVGPDKGPVDECEFCGRPESEHKPKGERP